MSNTFGVNIDASAVISQNEHEAYRAEAKNKTPFDPKNYLNARLERSEQTKKLKIRLLPFSPDGGTPFEKVYIHQVRVTQDDGSMAWRTFMCPVKNHKGDKCPFCELSEQARQLRNSATNETEKKKYGDVQFQNRAREAWIVRCIDRAHEEDGVKFWRFTSSRKKDGVYDKIMNVFSERWAEAKEQGREYNIFDVNNGKDLNITLTRDANNKTAIQVTDASTPTPLSDSYEKGMGWINDSKKWTDVYSVKPYDYMAIIVQGGIPMFDQDLGCYVDKKEHAEIEREARAQEIQENLTEQKRDFTQFVENNVITDNNKVADTVNQTATADTKFVTKEPVMPQPSSVSDTTYDDDDLPF